MSFNKDDYVKIVDVEGNHHYGYIQESRERGFILVISLYEEGTSAIEYEINTGTVLPDWETWITEAEKKLLPLIALNYSTREIADQLNLTPVTIRQHMRNLKIKLQLVNRSQLVTFAQALEAKKNGGTPSSLPA